MSRWSEEVPSAGCRSTKSRVVVTMSSGRTVPDARATRWISVMASASRRRVPGRERSAPIGASVTEPRPPKGATKRNLAQSSAQMSWGTTAVTPASSSARRRVSTRSEGRLSHSPKVSEPRPPTWRIRPGPARYVMIFALPRSTASRPTTSATSAGASTPFCVVRTAVPSSTSGFSRGRADGSCQVFTPSRTWSTGPISDGSSVARSAEAGTEKPPDASPSGPSTVSPSRRRASRCRPRATNRTSCPAAARRPPK